MQALSPTTLLRTALTGALLAAVASEGFANGGADSTPPAFGPSPQATADNDFRVYWKNSINFETGDKQFKFKIGGRLQNDWWFITGQDQGLKDELAGRSPVAEQASGTEFRRARIYMSGTLWESMVFKWAYDFAGGTPEFKDAYIGWKDVPALGTLLVGQQKEPIGLEFAYSSNAATFIARGLPHYMNPERSTGVRFSRTVADEAVYLTAGGYRPSNDQGDSGLAGDAWALSGRAAWTPIFRDKGEKLLHLGINGSYRTGLDVYGKSAKPEVHGMSRYVAALVNDVDNVLIGGVEASTNIGPVSIQGEYVVNSISKNTGGDVSWSGWYTFVSWFLTGEHRAYRRDRGAYKAVTPKHNRGADGSGAWELGLRYSSLDLGDANNSTATTSGQLDDITAGVNWYMNYNSRIMLNYIHADLQDVGTSDAVALRFQVFF